MIGEYTVLYVIGNFIVMLLGVFSHFVKKKMKGQTLDDVKNYFRSHFANTVITFGAGIVMFFAMVQSGGLGWVASLLLGYTADSVFNKAEGDTNLKN